MQDVGRLQVAMNDALLVRDAHADADVARVRDDLLRLHRLLVRDLGAERVRGEVLHRDRVAAADVQEVVNPDHVLVRDPAGVAQLVHEALEHLLVRGDVRVQELQDQAFLDDRVLDEHHGAERALADLLDELVAAFDHVAGVQRVQIERRRLGRRRLDALVRAFDEQRACGRRRAGVHRRRGRLHDHGGATAAGGRRVAPRADGAARVVAAPRVGAVVGPGAGSGVAEEAGVEEVADGVKRPVIDVRPSSFCYGLVDRAQAPSLPRPPRPAECRASRPRPAARRRVARRRRSRRRARPSPGAAGTAAPCRGVWNVPTLPTALSAIGQRAVVARDHLEQGGQGLRVADLRERVGGSLADPPIRVLRRLDELVDGALVAARDEDLDRGAADVLVLVFDEIEHGVHDARAADARERVGSARAYPPILVGDRVEQILDAVRRADLVQDLDRGPAAELVLGLQRGRSGTSPSRDRSRGQITSTALFMTSRSGSSSKPAISCDVDRALRT